MIPPAPGAPDRPRTEHPARSWTDMRWNQAVLGAVLALCGAAVTGAGIAGVTSDPPMVAHLMVYARGAAAGLRSDQPNTPTTRESGVAALPSQLTTTRPTGAGPRPGATVTGAVPAGGATTTTTTPAPPPPPPPAPSASEPSTPEPPTTTTAEPPTSG